MPRLKESKDLARAVRRHAIGQVEQNAQRIVKAIVRDNDPLTVELLRHDIQVTSEHLLLGSWTRMYDRRYGIDVGDTLLMVRIEDGDWLVLDVIGDDDFDLGDHPEDGTYAPYSSVMGQVLARIPYRDQDGSDIGTLIAYDPAQLTAPVVNGKWIKGVGGAAVWSDIVAGDITAATNGQWIKGVGGVGVWAPIGAADVGGANLVAAFSGATIAGPWDPPKTMWSITLARKSDVLLIVHASIYSSAVGMSGFAVWWDGGTLTNWGSMFFNETLSHKWLSCSNVISGAAAGSHTIQVVHGFVNSASDVGDQANFSALAVAVP